MIVVERANGRRPSGWPPRAPVLSKGTRVLVVPLGQRGIVRQRRRDRVQVHFGSAHGQDFLSWHSWRDLEVLP